MAMNITKGVGGTIVGAGVGAATYFAAVKLGPNITFLQGRWWAMPTALLVAGHLVKLKAQEAGAAMTGAAGALLGFSYYVQSSATPTATTTTTTTTTPATPASPAPATAGMAIPPGAYAHAGIPSPPYAFYGHAGGAAGALQNRAGIPSPPYAFYGHAGYVGPYHNSPFRPAIGGALIRSDAGALIS
jgi:hypothetical protein